MLSNSDYKSTAEEDDLIIVDAEIISAKDNEV